MCSCGHDRNHAQVEANPRYSLWGYFKLGLVGITAIPIEVEFQCSRCHQFFEKHAILKCWLSMLADACAGIETSCDETSLAIVRDGRECLAVKTYSQIKEHAAFRGVVPEIASRAHLEKINYLYESVLQEASISVDELDAVAVTTRPGLVGSLLMEHNLPEHFLWCRLACCCCRPSGSSFLCSLP